MRQRILSLIIIAFSPVVALGWTAPVDGCGTTNQEWTVKKIANPGALPTPDGSAQIVYFNRAGIEYFKQVKIAVDGQWKAATSRNSYAVFQVPAGDHSVCATAGKWGPSSPFKVSIPIKTEAGKTYFIGESTPGLTSQAYLELMSEENGQAQLHNFKQAISSPKN